MSDLDTNAPIDLHEAWDMGLAFSPLPDQDDTPALQLARFMWSRINFPLGDHSGLCPGFFDEVRRTHNELRLAADSGDPAIVREAAIEMSDFLGKLDFVSDRDHSSFLDFCRSACRLKEAPDVVPPVISPLDPDLLEEARWLHVGIGQCGFSQISLSPFAVSRDSFRIVANCQRLSGVFGVDVSMFGLGGEVSFRLSCPKWVPSKYGSVSIASYTLDSQEMTIYSSQEGFSKEYASAFSHEWMHALEDVSKKVKWLYPVHDAVFSASKLFNSMSQDTMEARKFINMTISNIGVDFGTNFTNFFEKRASPEAREMYFSGGSVSRAFVRDLLSRLLSIKNDERRARVLADTMAPMLASGQPPLNMKAVAKIADSLAIHVDAFSAVSSGTNLFKVNAKYMDKKSGRYLWSYWSNPSEMLARAFELFVTPDMRTDDCREGSERSQVFRSIANIGVVLNASFAAKSAAETSSDRRTIKAA